MNHFELEPEPIGYGLSVEASVDEIEPETELNEDELDDVAGGDWAPTPPPPSTGSGGG